MILFKLTNINILFWRDVIVEIYDSTLEINILQREFKIYFVLSEKMDKCFYL